MAPGVPRWAFVTNANGTDGRMARHDDGAWTTHADYERDTSSLTAANAILAEHAARTERDNVALRAELATCREKLSEAGR